MARGKQTCKILKEIRRQIAEANDIEFITSECQYQGDCLGTCPKCEAEVRYLEQQLERKRRVGKAITLFGLSTGILTIIPPTSLDAETLQCPKMNWTITADSLIQEKDMKGEAPFYGPEKLPEFPGGTEKFIEFLKENLRYSEIDSIANNTYTDVKFTIDYDGQVINPKITRKIHPKVEAEILRVMSLIPRWTPGILANETVQVTYNLMLSFSAMYGPELRITYTRINYPDVYEKVPVMPDFPEGQQALMEFLAKKIQHPNAGLGGNGVQGRTIIQFIVDKEGNIVKPKVLRGVDPYLDKEALRVINQMPKWKPGELEDGTKVAVYFTVPVMFRLQ